MIEDLRHDPFWNEHAQFLSTVDRAVQVFEREKHTSKHFELLEGILGIATLYSQGNISDARVAEVQLRVVVDDLFYGRLDHPADESSQLLLMLYEPTRPEPFRSYIATKLLGFESITELENTVRTQLSNLNSN